MPSAARKPRTISSIKPTARPHSIEHLEEENEIQDRLLRPSELEEPWKKKVQEFEADIWTSQELMPQALRDECLAYLYRLEPEVFNAAGKGSNIGKYQIPITIEKIKKQHGGGKYKLWIKRGPRNMGQEIFSVEGTSIIEADQTTRDGRPAAAPSQNNQMSDVVRAVKEILVETQGSGGQKANDGVVEILKTAYSNGLEMQNEAAKAALHSPTGDKVTDSILPKLIDRLFQAPPATPPVDVLALVEKIVSITAKMQKPAEPAERISAGDQFKFVQDLLGVDNFKDILNFHERKSDVTPWWAGPLTGLANNLPSVLSWIANQQEQSFRRQVYLSQLKPGEVPVAPGPQLLPPPGAAPLTFPGAGMPTREELINKLIGEVTRYFQAGWDGYGCAAHVLMSPDLAPALQQLLPVLSNAEALNQTIAQIPVLAGLAQNPNWGEFVAGFVETIRDAMAPKDEDEDGGVEEIPVAEAAGGTVPTKRKKPKVITEIPKPN